MTSHRGHERAEELLALVALDALGDEERAELERSRADIDGCADCSRLRREYLEATAELAYALPPSALPAGATRRLLDATSTETAEPAIAVAGRTTGRTLSVSTGRHAVARPRRSRRSRRRGWLPTAMVAAVAVVLGVTGGIVVAPHVGPGSDRTTAEAPTVLAAFLADPDTRLVALPPSSGSSVSGRVSVAYRPGESDAWIIEDGMPRPEDDHVYQLWFGTKGTTGMSPADTFSPHGDRSLALHTRVGERIDALAVTVEPHGGSAHPTTDPLAVVSV